MLNVIMGFDDVIYYYVAELVCLAGSHASLNNNSLQSQVNTLIPSKNLHLYSVSV